MGVKSLILTDLSIFKGRRLYTTYKTQGGNLENYLRILPIRETISHLPSWDSFSLLNPEHTWDCLGLANLYVSHLNM